MAKFTLALWLLLALLGCQSRGQTNNPAAAELLERPVLRPSDFEYVGSFAPPKAAVDNPQGGKWSTGYGLGGLALRRVGGELRFFATTHVYSGGLLYEMKFPGLSKTVGLWPRAEVVREWGDVYRGRKQLAVAAGGNACGGRDGTLSSGSWTHGLFWDEAKGRLYWSYGNWYNGAHCNNPALGYSTLGAAGATASGPWTSLQGKGGAHAQMMRGGVLRIPQWFAERFLGGRSFGVGFGGYYSIIAGGSQGPSLFAALDPDPNNLNLETLPLLNFPSGQKARRNPDYFLARDPSGNPIPSWDKEPVDGKGFWTAADTLEGAAVWIDTPTKQGLIYFPRLGHGRVSYDSGAITWARQKQWWYVYSPKDLAEVTRGQKQPWEIEPSHTAEADFALEAPEMRVTGAAFDGQEQTLYLYVYQAYKDGVERYPLVRAYKLK